VAKAQSAPVPAARPAAGEQRIAAAAQRPSPALRGFALACAVGMFLVVVMGALVTDTASGQGCGGSWPLCNGRLLPGPALHALVEYSHRAVAGVVGVAVMALGLWAWRRHGRWPEVRWLGAVGISFVWVQSLLGAAAVLWPQAPAVLALHFGFSLTAFAGALLLAVVLGQLDAPGRGAPSPWREHPVPAALARATWALLAYTYLLVYLGAYVAHTGSGLACLGWPLCSGRLVPALAGATGVAFAHRLAALVGLVWTAWLRRRLAALGPARDDLRRGGNAALAAMGLQVASGALLPWTRLSTGAILLHGTLVCAVFGALAYLALQVLPARGAVPAPAA
jgi:cytochrome c oxidase assembly protein subunit 15